MNAILIVLYPKTEGSRFDYDYYLQNHMPFVKQKLKPFGLQEARLMRGTGALNGATPSFELIGELSFYSMQQLQYGLAAHGKEILADIPNHTDTQPVIQISEAP